MSCIADPEAFGAGRGSRLIAFGTFCLGVATSNCVEGPAMGSTSSPYVFNSTCMSSYIDRNLAGKGVGGMGVRGDMEIGL